MKENNVFTNSLLGAIIQDSGMRERSNASDKLFFELTIYYMGYKSSSL